jgi:hypothetical protein
MRPNYSVLSEENGLVAIVSLLEFFVLVKMVIDCDVLPRPEPILVKSEMDLNPGWRYIVNLAFQLLYAESFLKEASHFVFVCADRERGA